MKNNTLMSLCSFLLAATATQAAHREVYVADIIPLNAAFDDDGKLPQGTATLTLDLSETEENLMSGMASLEIRISVDGLEDLSEIGGVHVAHIHGQFFSNYNKEAPAMTNGVFFESEAGMVRDSVLPNERTDDADGDGFLNFFEGLPSYGPVIVDLTTVQVPPPPSGTPPLLFALDFLVENEIPATDVFPSGETFELDVTYTYDLSDPDARRQFKNLLPLSAREIVIHGQTVPTEISAPIDEFARSLGLPAALIGVDLDNGETLRTTAPVAVGDIKLAKGPQNIFASNDEGFAYSWFSAELFVGAYPYVYHPQLEWLFVDSGSTVFDSVIYSEDLGWFYTGKGYYPFLYLFDTDEVVHISEL